MSRQDFCEKFHGRLLERATDTEQLGSRLAMNERFSVYDFQSWVLEHLAPREGMRVLDVGCGRGAQAIPISHVIGATGSLVCLDLSQQSVSKVVDEVSVPGRVRGIVGSMDDLDGLLNSPAEKFDLIYSIYALYYANDPRAVLEHMYRRLDCGGRMAIAGPTAPHGLVEIMRKYQSIPVQVDKSFCFRQDVVEPFFQSHFDRYTMSCLKNPQRVDNVDQLIGFYQQTTYYDAATEPRLREYAEKEIVNKGAVIFDKNSYIAVGTKG